MKFRPPTAREWQRVAAIFPDVYNRRLNRHAPPRSEPYACTACGTKTAFTEDWTLYPWPDGAWLCRPCNDKRHELEEYDEVERRCRERNP